jgi:hypothetical protein
MRRFSTDHFRQKKADAPLPDRSHDKKSAFVLYCLLG